MTDGKGVRPVNAMIDPTAGGVDNFSPAAPTSNFYMTAGSGEGPANSAAPLDAILNAACVWPCAPFRRVQPQR